MIFLKRVSSKRFLILNILLVFVLFLTSCGASKEKPRVAVLKGPTSIGMANLMKKQENKYDFTIAASPDEIVPKIIQGEIDIAAVPSNLASVIYNKTGGKVQVLNINTLGVLFILENGNSVTSVEDLKGKTIFASGKGSTPEYTLNYILTENGINPETDLTIEYKSEHTEVVTSLLTTENSIALLPEPFVSIATTKTPDLRIALNLTSEWENINSKSSLVMGVTIARTEFIENNKKVIDTFLEESQESINIARFSPGETAVYLDEFGIFEKAVAEKAIPNSNIEYFDGDLLKEKLDGFLEVLYNQNPESVGGVLPDENFYYKK